MSAATLKLIVGAWNNHRGFRFRAHMSAATLKLIVGAWNNHRGFRFRAHMSAATLKRTATAPSPGMLVSIPRSHERGHIEALRKSAAFQRMRQIPRSHERGHIEADKAALIAIAQVLGQIGSVSTLIGRAIARQAGEKLDEHT